MCDIVDSQHARLFRKIGPPTRTEAARRRPKSHRAAVAELGAGEPSDPGMCQTPTRSHRPKAMRPHLPSAWPPLDSRGWRAQRAAARLRFGSPHAWASSCHRGRTASGGRRRRTRSRNRIENGCPGRDESGRHRALCPCSRSGSPVGCGLPRSAATSQRADEREPLRRPLPCRPSCCLWPSLHPRELVPAFGKPVLPGLVAQIQILAFRRI